MWRKETRKEGDSLSVGHLVKAVGVAAGMDLSLSWSRCPQALPTCAAINDGDTKEDHPGNRGPAENWRVKEEALMKIRAPPLPPRQRDGSQDAALRRWAATLWWKPYVADIKCDFRLKTAMLDQLEYKIMGRSTYTISVYTSISKANCRFRKKPYYRC